MKKNIEDSVEKELKRDRLVACVKAAGGVIIPIATLASLAGIAYSLSHAFEDKYLAGFIPSLCAVGMAPRFSAYPEIMRNLFGDIRYTSRRLKEYRAKLQEVE